MRRAAIPSLSLLLCSIYSISHGAGQGQNNLTLQNSPVPKEIVPGELLDIYGPLQLPEPANILNIILLTAALLLAATIIFFFFFRTKKTKSPRTIPPHTTALADLAQARHFLLSDQSIQYSDTVSEILRTYIEKRFHIGSTKKTTAEFITYIQNEEPGYDELTSYAPSLEICFQQCDMAKFAHKTSARKNMEIMEESVRTFIEETREKEV